MVTKKDPYDRLENLDAMSAIKAWLLGDYKRGEEPVLILAIRREMGLELTDAEIRDVMAEAYKGIKADLDFHESEGLESFDPKAAAAARAMRNEGVVAK